MNLRSGRLGKKMSAKTAEFTSSLEFDRYIFQADIECNRAHTTMLSQQKIIDPLIADKIIKSLEKLKKEGIEALNLDHSVEDIHMAVENYVTGEVGEEAGFMHTAKSRNDQVATDLRIVLKEKLNEIQGFILEFIEGILELAAEHQETVMIGYTHLQHAQPTTFAHHLMAYAHSLKRDYERLKDAYKRVNLNPLGSAAMTTTSFPIDRDITTDLLGFSAYMENSMDAVSSRDFIAETVFSLSLLVTTLSKICEEMVLWSTYEFGIIEIADEFSSTSSIMPQKKNPDVAEIARGKSGILYGELVTILTILKALPYNYNRDLQEITPHLWNGVKHSQEILDMVANMLLSVEVNKERCLELAGANFATATDLADIMVREKKMPFRTAHKIVGRMVTEAINQQLKPDQISGEFLDKISADITGDKLNLDEDLIKKSLDPLENVKMRTVPGGPSPVMVQKAIDNLREYITRERAKE
ncbi:MAG: argininosuccinate lyase [Euryarchaeota archaeon]|nr:argininosuccinate lyase [Euryarchaeota archaeon]MBV1729356.1 argininosuccinate lyase [Methanobacterium sp.]MBU4547758.1 argininosuccinate lyase [Euryarchaeota archaeon]MBU4607174.1 argininosuccinate lyase [Euryarchaeota archaeon]MBV1754275.1 argininosuccinate lyase [Methanobacterium sp.]